MALTSIGQQKTPGRPVEITFSADTGLPSDSQEVLLIGHAASGATGTNTVIVVENSGDVTAASSEVATKFGDGSEMAKMVLAAIRANSGGSTYPRIKAVPLDSTETSIPTDAQSAILATKAEYIVTPYDLHNDTAQRTILKTLAQTMSAAARVSNNQFGTFGVGANHDVSSPSSLYRFDTQYLVGLWIRDTGTGDNERTYSLGEDAAACAARMAANGIPFNPLDDVSIGSVPAPLQASDWITVGAGLESESCLERGWTPVYTKPNEEMAFVRTVTGRISADGTGSPVVGSYYDVQDFSVLYFWRKTLYTRFSQPDFKQRKASAEAAREIKSEAIRLAVQFEDQNMFQAVSQLAKEFQVERNASDRHRFDVKTPVNVIPGLHCIATNIVATTQYDVVSV
jgi:phage tail sheath gpL-like